MHQSVIVILNGDYYLLKLRQGSRNFRKWNNDKLSDVDVIDVAVLDSVDWSGEYRKEIQAIRKKLKNYPNRVHT